MDYCERRGGIQFRPDDRFRRSSSSRLPIICCCRFTQAGLGNETWGHSS